MSDHLQINVRGLSPTEAADLIERLEANGVKGQVQINESSRYVRRLTEELRRRGFR